MVNFIHLELNELLDGALLRTWDWTIPFCLHDSSTFATRNWSLNSKRQGYINPSPLLFAWVLPRVGAVTMPPYAKCFPATSATSYTMSVLDMVPGSRAVTIPFVFIPLLALLPQGTSL